MTVKENLEFLLKQTVFDLVHGDLPKVQLRKELTIDDIKEELNHWGTLTLPPKMAYEKINYIKYNDGLGYAMEFELWVDNRQSDLTLSIEAILDQSGYVLSFTIENIHVL